MAMQVGYSKLRRLISVCCSLVLLACAEDTKAARPDSAAAAATFRAKARARAESVYHSPTASLTDSLGEHALAHSAGVADSGKLHMRLNDAALHIADSIARQKRFLAVVLQNAMARAFPPYTAAQSVRVDHLNGVIAVQRVRDLEGERRDYARRVEYDLLDAGRDVRATVDGDYGTSLHIQYVLADRVMAHALGKRRELFDKWTKMGFKNVYLTDGFNYETHWTLTP